MPGEDETSAKNEAAGVALWLHEMAERGDRSTEDHIKLRFAAAMIEDRSEAASAMLAALKNARELLDHEHGGSTATARVLIRAAIATAEAAGIKSPV